MFQTYDSSGRRVRAYQPYIYAEETTYETSLYDPSRYQLTGIYNYGVTPSAVTTQENIEQYRLLKDSSGVLLQANPISRTYVDIATYPPNLARNVYTYHTGVNGHQTAYKNLFAM